MMYEGIRQKFPEWSKKERLQQVEKYIKTLMANDRGIEELKGLFELTRSYAWSEENGSEFHHQLNLTNEKFEMLDREKTKKGLINRFNECRGEFEADISHELFLLGD